MHSPGRARPSGTPSRFERGRPVALDGERARRGRADRAARSRWPRRSASAAAFIWATPSSAPRAAWPSRRPAAETLLTAHRELEKLVLTARQQRIKESVAGPYGDLVHEGQLLDPVCRDIEALLLSSQERVSGEVHLLLRPGSLFVEGVESPYSLMAASKGVYGEAAGEWTATDALGFSKIVALPGVFHRRAGEQASRRRSGTSHEDRGRRQDRLGHAGLRARPGAAALERHPGRGRRGDRRRDPQQQVHLQHARAHQRPHGQGRQGRHRGRRARAAARAVRLLGPRAEFAQARRCDPDAQHRRRHGHLRLGDRRQGQAVRLPRARRGAAVPVSRASASACRRASATARSISTHRSTRAACRWSRWPAPAWKPARPRPPRRSSRACATAA